MDMHYDFNMPMICGSAEAESKIYRVVTGNRGRRWLYAVNCENPAEYVYVEGGPNSDGFGGRVISFPLEDGTTLQLKGPWHANSDSMFEETGVDIRDKYLTYGIVSKSFKADKDNWNAGTFIDVIHVDQKPTLGVYKRIDLIAQKYADETGETCHCFSKSLGGSHRRPVHPTKK